MNTWFMCGVYISENKPHVLYEIYAVYVWHTYDKYSRVYM